MSDTNDKQQKREARKLREQAAALFEAGNYREARILNERIVAMAPGTDVAAAATAEIENLGIDPWTVYGGLIALALYLLAWIVALF